MSAWVGLPLSTCRFEASGRTGAHAIVVDTVLVWGGGKSQVDIQCGGRSFSLERLSGMVDVLPAGVSLDEVRWKGQPTECIAVLLPPAQLEAIGLSRPQVEPERCLRIGATDAHIVDLVRRLQARAAEAEASEALYVKGLSLTLASYVFSRFAAEMQSVQASGSGGSGLSPSQRQRLVAWIDARLAEPIQLGALAREVGYSQDHFVRLFGSAFGVPPHRYVMSRRIERAKSMLDDPTCSLIDVALACGFSSQPHFSTVFKLHVGVSPGRYRNHGGVEPRRTTTDAGAARGSSFALGGATDTPRQRLVRGALPSVLRGTCPAAFGALVSSASKRD